MFCTFISNFDSELPVVLVFLGLSSTFCYQLLSVVMLNQWWQQWMKDDSGRFTLTKIYFHYFRKHVLWDSYFFSLYFLRAIRPKVDNASAKQRVTFTYINLQLYPKSGTKQATKLSGRRQFSDTDTEERNFLVTGEFCLQQFFNIGSVAAEQAELGSLFHHCGTTELTSFAWDLFLCVFLNPQACCHMHSSRRRTLACASSSLKYVSV